jgi:hypothetical protein
VDIPVYMGMLRVRFVYTIHDPFVVLQDVLVVE